MPLPAKTSSEEMAWERWPWEARLKRDWTMQGRLENGRVLLGGLVRKVSCVSLRVGEEREGIA